MGNDTNFDRLGYSMYFSKFFPFILLSRQLNVFDRTYFLVLDLLTPFSYARVFNVNIGVKQIPNPCACSFWYAYHDRSFQILSNC